MKRSITLSIPKPCSESWDAMQPEGCGRFCSACEKMVVDFTRFGDEDLVLFFEKTAQATCGRFTRQQLDQLQSLPPTPSFFSKQGKYITALLMAALGIASRASAQQPNAPLVHSSPVADRQSGQKQKNTDTTATREITGRILDEEGTSIIAAAVLIPGTTQATISDVDGNFRISYPAHLIVNNQVRLHISVAGYEEADNDFVITNKNQLRIVLRSKEWTLVGDIQIVRKPTLWQRLTKPFRKKY